MSNKLVYFQRLNRLTYISSIPVAWKHARRIARKKFLNWSQTKLCFEITCNWMTCQTRKNRAHLFSHKSIGDDPSTPRPSPTSLRRDRTSDQISSHWTFVMAHHNLLTKLKFDLLGPSLMLLWEGTLLNHAFSCKVDSRAQKHSMMASAMLVAPAPLINPALAESLST